jgi:hypothetical protein
MVWETLASCPMSHDSFFVYLMTRSLVSDKKNLRDTVTLILQPERHCDRPTMKFFSQRYVVCYIFLVVFNSFFVHRETREKWKKRFINRHAQCIRPAKKKPENTGRIEALRIALLLLPAMHRNIEHICSHRMTNVMSPSRRCLETARKTIKSKRRRPAHDLHKIQSLASCTQNEVARDSRVTLIQVLVDDFFFIL